MGSFSIKAPVYLMSLQNPKFVVFCCSISSVVVLCNFAYKYAPLTRDQAPASVILLWRKTSSLSADLNGNPEWFCVHE